MWNYGRAEVASPGGGCRENRGKSVELSITLANWSRAVEKTDPNRDGIRRGIIRGGIRELSFTLANWSRAVEKTDPNWDGIGRGTGSETGSSIFPVSSLSGRNSGRETAGQKIAVQQSFGQKFRSRDCLPEN